MVLGSRPHHGRAADIDLLDHLGRRDALAAGRFLERVQVDAHQVDRRYATLRQGAAVLFEVAACEQGPVHRRMQRLDASAHHLGGAREVLHRHHGEPRLAQSAGGPSRGDQLDTAAIQEPGEVNQATLVADRQQRPPHRNET